MLEQYPGGGLQPVFRVMRVIFNKVCSRGVQTLGFSLNPEEFMREKPLKTKIFSK